MVPEADSTGVIGSGEGEDPFPLGTSQGGKVFNGGKVAGSTGVVQEMGEGGEGSIAKCVIPPSIRKALGNEGAKGKLKQSDRSGTGKFGKGDLHRRHMTKSVKGRNGSSAESTSDET